MSFKRLPLTCECHLRKTQKIYGSRLESTNPPIVTRNLLISNEQICTCGIDFSLSPNWLELAQSLKDLIRTCGHLRVLLDSQVWGFSNLRAELDYTDPKLKARDCHLRGERCGNTCACAPTGEPRPNNCAYQYRPNLRVRARSSTYTLLGVMK